ncbi:spore coat protein, partial [Bacillus cereus]
MCDCEVCRRKKKRDPLNRGSEPKKQDSESVNSYSF